MLDNILCVRQGSGDLKFGGEDWYLCTYGGEYGEDFALGLMGIPKQGTEPYGWGDSCVHRTKQGRLPGGGEFEFKMI